MVRRVFVVFAVMLLAPLGCEPDADSELPTRDASTDDVSSSDSTTMDSGEGEDVGDAEDGSWGDSKDGRADGQSDTGADVDDGGSDELCSDGSCTPQECTENGWVPPGNLDRDTQPLLDEDTTARTWAEFYGVEFPQGGARFLEVEPDHYATFAFDTNDFDGEGTIIFDNPQAAGPWGSRLIAISQCPGYFGESPYPADEDCREWKFAVGNIPYAVGDGSDATFSCDLRADRQYYLNIVFVDEVMPEGAEDLTWQCAVADIESDRWDSCGALMQATHVIEP